jgi:hypothetical protein
MNELAELAALRPGYARPARCQFGGYKKSGVSVLSRCMLKNCINIQSLLTPVDALPILLEKCSSYGSDLLQML